MIFLGFLTYAPRRLGVTPTYVTAEQNEGLTDAYTLTFDNTEAESMLKLVKEHRGVQSGAVGPPALLTIENGTVYQEVYGYIDTAAVDYDRAGTHCSLIFMGAAAVLRSGTARTWSNKTAFEIAYDILRPHGLGLEMDAAPFVFPFYDQSSDSDWETLSKLAAASGLSLTADGVVVRMLNILKESYRARGSNAPLYRRPGVIGTGFGIEADTFSMIETNSPLGGERHSYYGIDSFGSSFAVEGGTSTVTRSPDAPVSTLEDALREVHRSEQVINYATRGMLDGLGSATARSGECIAVENVDGYREFWYVLGARQAYSTVTNEHRTSFTLCLPAADVEYGYTPARRRADRPAPFLVQGKWRGDREWAVQL